MNAYSKDLRLKVLDALAQVLPRKEAARLFEVSLSTIKRYLKLRKHTRDVAAKPSPGRTPTIGKSVEHRRALCSQLEANRDANLERHCELWEARHGVKVSISTMSRAIRKLGWLHKKGLGSYRGDKEERSAWRKRISQIDPSELLFVDECGTNISLTPLYARAPQGERTYSKTPRNWGKNLTFLASLSSEGTGATIAIEGATNNVQSFEITWPISRVQPLRTLL
jgi:transposase